MQLAYSIALLLGLFITAPYFILRGLRYKKYFSDFGQRLGRLEGIERPSGDRTIWIHSVSVGETLAAEPLLGLFAERFPRAVFALSTTTETAQALARARAQQNSFAFYFPFDFLFCLRRSLDFVKPSMVVLVETEIWPNLLCECERRQIPVALANARLSDRSYRGYNWIRPFMRRTLARFSAILAQTEADRSRFLSLGVDEQKVLVSGNLKYDIADNGAGARLECSNFLPADGVPLIVAGSTADREEQILLDAFRRARSATGHKLRLLIAPRRPERFDEVERLIGKTGFACARRSALTRPDSGAEIILLDTMGELAAVYEHATVVFVGGSLIQKGGHNILEPARYGKPIVVGPHMENFRQIAHDFLAADALRRLPDAEPERLGQLLGVTLTSLINSPAERETLGKNARAMIDQNRGATARVAEALAQILELHQASPQPRGD